MKYFTLFSLFLFVGCIPSVNILKKYNADGFVITDLKNSNSELLIDTNLDIREFKLSFKKEYGTEAKFFSLISNQLSKKLGRFINLSNDNSKEKEDYFIEITNVIISNNLSGYGQTYSSPHTVSTPGGKMSVGGGITGGGQAEECVVSIKAEIWSVKDKKTVSEFTSIGKGGVYLLMFRTALKKAVKNAIANFTKYIEKNKIK